MKRSNKRRRSSKPSYDSESEESEESSSSSEISTKKKSDRKPSSRPYYMIGSGQYSEKVKAAKPSSSTIRTPPPSSQKKCPHHKKSTSVGSGGSSGGGSSEDDSVVVGNASSGGGGSGGTKLDESISEATYTILQLKKNLSKLAKNITQNRKNELKQIKTIQHHISEVETNNKHLIAMLETLQNDQQKETMYKDYFNGHKLSNITDEDLSRLVKQYSKEKKDRTRCTVCMEGIKSIICLPCGHLCLCEECAGATSSGNKKKVSVCPTCNQMVQSRQKCYIYT